MTILDRYLLFLFLRIFLICFASFVGLFIVVHLFSNLDELSALAEPAGGWGSLLLDFYWPRVAELFDKTAAVLVLISGIFAVNMMQKRREILAIEAGGVTPLRAIRPILVGGLAIIALTVWNRENVIPRFKESLVRTPQNWMDKGRVDMSAQVDNETGVRFRGREIYLGDRKIVQPNVQLPSEVYPGHSRIESENGFFEPETEEHPAGIRLVGVTQPSPKLRLASAVIGEKPTVFYPSDQKWLGEKEAFVATSLSMEQVAFGSRLSQYRTTPEMMAAVRQPQKWFGNNQRVGLHTRILQPFLDLTLLLLGLPLAMSNSDRNIFVAAGVSFLVVAGVSVVTLTAQSLGAYNIVRPAALAAWLPLLVFTPLAILSMGRLK